jgi:hypothetical protein
MITDVRIDHDRRRVIVVVGPTLAPDEIRRVIAEQAHAGLWAYDVLCDERANTTAFSADDVRDLVAYVNGLVRTHGARGRMAIVPNDDVQYGMARMYSLLAENGNVECRVFRNVANAEAWLDQTPV